MGRVQIRLQYNLETGKKDVWIDLVSELDVLPIEHEQDHRKIVEDLLGKGILAPDELGEVTVQRVAPGAAPAAGETGADQTETRRDDGVEADRAGRGVGGP